MNTVFRNIAIGLIMGVILITCVRVIDGDTHKLGLLKFNENGELVYTN